MLRSKIFQDDAEILTNLFFIMEGYSLRMTVMQQNRLFDEMSQASQRVEAMRLNFGDVRVDDLLRDIMKSNDVASSVKRIWTDGRTLVLSMSRGLYLLQNIGESDSNAKMADIISDIDHRVPATRALQ